MSGKLVFADLSHSDTGAVQAKAAGAARKRARTTLARYFMAPETYRFQVARGNMRASGREPAGDRHPGLTARHVNAQRPGQHQEQSAESEHRVQDAVPVSIVDQRADHEERRHGSLDEQE